MNVRKGLTLITVVGAAIAIASIALTALPASAQHPVENTEFMVRNLRDFGQPVIPVFEGWFPGRNGGHDICFGYFNMNLKQSLDIPIGPDNHVEPSRYDGGQPTHFDPVPPAPQRYRRTFCAFTVHVDDPSEKVTWTLTQDGRDYVVPSNDIDVYQINEPIQDSRNSVAPVVRFQPSGPEGWGRDGTLWGPTRTVAVGQPLELTVSARLPDEGRAGALSVDDDSAGDEEWFARWAMHSGPGEVTFSSREDEPGGWVTISEGGEGTDQATFTQPGRYVLRLQVIDAPGEGGSFQFQCCWTNAYTEVNVTAR